MNTSWTPIKTAVALALCGAAFAFAPAHAAGQAASTSKEPAMLLGAIVLPGDDFYAYANGEWMARTEIPADRGSWGAMGALAEETNARIVKLIEEAGSDKSASAEARKVADFYKAYMNEAAIESAENTDDERRLRTIAETRDQVTAALALNDPAIEETVWRLFGLLSASLP